MQGRPDSEQGVGRSRIARPGARRCPLQRRRSSPLARRLPSVFVSEYCPLSRPRQQPSSPHPVAVRARLTGPPPWRCRPRRPRGAGALEAPAGKGIPAKRPQDLLTRIGILSRKRLSRPGRGGRRPSADAHRQALTAVRSVSAELPARRPPRREGPGAPRAGPWRPQRAPQAAPLTAADAYRWALMSDNYLAVNAREKWLSRTSCRGRPRGAGGDQPCARKRAVDVGAAVDGRW